MINVQIDVTDPADPLGEGTAVWSGVLPELPAGGDTLEIRGERPGGVTSWQQRPVTSYRVTGKAHWVIFTEDRAALHSSVILDVALWDPDTEEPDGLPGD